MLYIKALIFADSHSDVDTMAEVVQIEQPGLIFHLGDQVKDALTLHSFFPDIPLHYVVGNTDSPEDGNTEILIPLGQHRILLTHGHLNDVDQQLSGITNLFSCGEEKQADIVLFGHSHQPFTYCRNRIWLFNPGRIGRKSSKIIHATYGVLLIHNRQLELIHKVYSVSS